MKRSLIILLIAALLLVAVAPAALAGPVDEPLWSGGGANSIERPSPTHGQSGHGVPAIAVENWYAHIPFLQQ